MSIRAGVVVAVALHQIDHTPHGKASTEGDNESLQYSDRLSNKCHRFFLLISCCFLKMGIKKKPRRCSALNLAVRLGSLRSAATGL